jgi:hypothetical protein
MPLPTSGQLSISQIRNEQVNNGGFGSTYSLRQLSANAGKSTPDAISEFYGYSAAPSTVAVALYLYKFPTSVGGGATLFVNNTSVGSISTNGSTIGANIAIGGTFRVTVTGVAYKDLSIIRNGNSIYSDIVGCSDFRNINSDTITVTAGSPYDAYAYIEQCYDDGGGGFG